MVLVNEESLCKIRQKNVEKKRSSSDKSLENENQGRERQKNCLEKVMCQIVNFLS